ncbi:unnamed protein product [Rotaria sp. Silwood2]|nr:unnamed protein product [Rotaria sp. Silwood2]CAF4403810.1 unnamed protein product [Rotaria sp. Silwood2]
MSGKNGMLVNRPGHNGTYVSFHDATLNGTVVLSYDAGWSSNIIYSGSTIIIYAPYAWTPGHLYYITFDSGVSSGNDFCHAESQPIVDPTFWQFDIWNPAVSSTTTTTTTAPTTHTVTTRVSEQEVFTWNICFT